jgi:hypothetical protein
VVGLPQKTGLNDIEISQDKWKVSEKRIEKRRSRGRKEGAPPIQSVLGEVLQDYRSDRNSPYFALEESEETVVKPLSSVPNKSITRVHYLTTCSENKYSFFLLKSIFVSFGKYLASKSRELQRMAFSSLVKNQIRNFVGQ